MAKRSGRALRLAATATLVSAALSSAPLAAHARPPATSGATAEVPVAYDCFVTYPGGDTIVGYSLTYGVTAPDGVTLLRPFTVTLDPPPITPNPTLQTDVRDVEVAYELPANTLLLGYRLRGGSGLGDARPTVSRDGSVLTLHGPGPYAAGTVFDLPSLTVALLPVRPGAAQTITGGTSYDDPSFAWMRNSLSPGDPPGTYRPFLCQPPADVVLSTTTVGPLG